MHPCHLAHFLASDRKATKAGRWRSLVGRKKKLKFKNYTIIDPRCLDSPLSSWTRFLRSRTNRPGPTQNSTQLKRLGTRLPHEDCGKWLLEPSTLELDACLPPSSATNKKLAENTHPLPKWFKTIFCYGSLLTKKKLKKAHDVDTMINHFTELLVESLSLEIVFSHVHHLPTSPRKDPWPGADKSYPFFK